MLAFDSLVLDLIFLRGEPPAPEDMIEALGGKEFLSQRKVLDPDMQDPRFEMELSPSMPFRRRGERRIMLIDDSVAPMRKDPRVEPIVKLDLRPEKERLFDICQALPLRVGRLSALGTWGDAVLIARSVVDLRALALLSWVLDPMVDGDGKRRAGQLSQSEFEAKLVNYEKRLEELDEQAILANLHTPRIERHADLIVLDVLEDDGTWDVRKSLAMEAELAAIAQFSLMPGAPAKAVRERKPGAKPSAKSSAENGAKPKAKDGAKESGKGKADTSPSTASAEPAGKTAAPSPFAIHSADGERLLLKFLPERFDLDIAATLGKGDYESLIAVSVAAGDVIPGQVRDRLIREGADFLAPLEFLSEVFLDGKPLSRQTFDASAEQLRDGVRTLDAHYPRFGPVVVVDIAGKGRYICSAADAAAAVRIAESTT